MDENPYRAEESELPDRDQPDPDPVWDRIGLIATAILNYFVGPLFFAIIAVMLIRLGLIADLPD